MGNFYLIILDGVGCGHQEDAAAYGDTGSNTLGHTLYETGVALPNFEKLGLGNIIPLKTVLPVAYPLCAWGKMREVSAGKDSTTGHWEIAGIPLDTPFPTYPQGFPEAVLAGFREISGTDGVLANAPYSGTEVIADYGREHLETGRPIVYTSADSVFQVACHQQVTPVEQLYAWCKTARETLLTGEHAVGRVIARPFAGQPGHFYRLTEQRLDFSLEAPVPNIMSQLHEHGIKTYAIGKIIDLFGPSHFTQYRKTGGNAEGISQLLSMMSAVENSFVFVNLIDTDQLYGHRNDPEGFAGSLQEFDRAIPALFNKLKEDDMLIITADHGNDPTTGSSDHAREFVPVLLAPRHRAGRSDLGTRARFSDLACTAMDFFGLPAPFRGSSLLKAEAGSEPY